ncbi:hypothetical protein JCGZ_26090 [Jatropha curcas]|uniref:Uncharacterized protein n=1 Tax=Jatropha curcas TaxID=180498 RepID=A0A067JRW4_JATCU|nr:uncharacterized protein At3g49055 [Jatropha curcas]KDP22259.1 hypothetical protein JCGZ_26090 [Jatropha curcas]
METTTSENHPQPQINGLDSPTIELPNHDDLLVELRSLRQSYEALQSKYSTMEENLFLFQKQRDEALHHNTDLKVVICEISHERDSLQEQIRELEVSSKEREDEFERRIDEELSRKEELEKEVEVAKVRIEKLEFEINEAERKILILLKTLDFIRPAKDCLVGIIECLDDEKVVERVNNDEGSLELELDNESRALWEEFTPITRLASEAKSKVIEFKEMKKNEKRELENSVVSLTEENRDISSLLRVALLEKEAVEKSLNKLKGNTEQKRVALLQIAERGLQRVGFGFMMGSGSTDQSVENSIASNTGTPASTTASTKSDSSECEEEVVSLASTVERIMKNLRLEISQLRRSLEESRSDNERLQSLTEKQAQQIAENTLYIKELEERERLLVQNAEELLTEIKETEEEVARWREACELEVQAGKNEIEERDKVVVILKQELERTKAALMISNGKLQLKEELAAAAMAAQAAAEKSLQLADIRAAELHKRIEELRKQLEESESREHSRRKVRHICWPWRTLKFNSVNNANERVQNARRMLPEMQSLLRYTL